MRKVSDESKACIEAAKAYNKDPFSGHWEININTWSVVCSSSITWVNEHDYTPDTINFTLRWEKNTWRVASVFVVKFDNNRRTQWLKTRYNLFEYIHEIFYWIFDKAVTDLHKQQGK
jgi:hypothetical protein